MEISAKHQLTEKNLHVTCELTRPPCLAKCGSSLILINCDTGLLDTAARYQPIPTSASVAEPDNSCAKYDDYSEGCTNTCLSYAQSKHAAAHKVHTASK